MTNQPVSKHRATYVSLWALALVIYGITMMMIWTLL